MLKASTDLGIDRSVSRVSLPVAVAIFRVTSPAMNLAVAIYVAPWLGISLAPSTIAEGPAVAEMTTIDRQRVGLGKSASISVVTGDSRSFETNIHKTLQKP